MATAAAMPSQTAAATGFRGPNAAIAATEMPAAAAAKSAAPNAAIGRNVAMRVVRTAPTIERNAAIKVQKVANRPTGTSIVTIAEEEMPIAGRVAKTAAGAIGISNAAPSEEQNAANGMTATPTVTTGDPPGRAEIGATAILREASPKTASKICGSLRSVPSGIGD